MARAQWLGMTLDNIRQIAANPSNGFQKEYQDTCKKVLFALTVQKKDWPKEDKPELLQIRKRYKRNMQTGRKGMPRPISFISQSVLMFENDRAISNLRPRKDEELDLDFWLNDPEFMKE